MNALACSPVFGSRNIIHVWITWTFFTGRGRALTTRNIGVEQGVPLGYRKGEQGRCYGCEVRGLRRWLPPETGSEFCTSAQQSDFTLTSQQRSAVPTKALSHRPQNHGLRQHWGLAFPRAVKCKGLPLGTGEEGDAVPCCLQKRRRRLPTPTASEERLTPQIL